MVSISDLTRTSQHVPSSNPTISIHKCNLKLMSCTWNRLWVIYEYFLCVYTMFWWPTCDINCHRIMGDYIHLLSFPALLSFPNSSGSSYIFCRFSWWMPLAVQPTPGLSQCVCRGVGFFRGFPWASRVSQDHGKVRVRLLKFRLSGKDASIWTKAMRSNLSKCCKKM